MPRWVLPPDSLLPSPDLRTPDLGNIGKRLEGALADLGVPSTVVGTVIGPATVLFQLRPADGVRMREFTRLSRADDLRFALAVEHVRILAPIPGQQLVGIEIPSPDRRVVALSEVVGLAHRPLTAALGIGSDLTPVSLDLASAPHMLVAGESGSGKSSLLHTVIGSLLMRVTPRDLRFVMIDLKRTELGRYGGIPHLMYRPVTEGPKAVRTLEKMVSEVERRTRLLERAGVQDVADYTGSPSLPRVLVVVDEFAELMYLDRNHVEPAVTRIAQLGRACGVHLILATQSPYRQVITGLIQANVPARVGLRVTEAVHSRVALDQGGAEDLLGRGDALLRDGSTVGMQRFQSAYVPADTIDQIVTHWRAQTPQAPQEEALVPTPDSASTRIVPARLPSGSREAPPTIIPRRRPRHFLSGLALIVAIIIGILAVIHLGSASGACPSGTDQTTNALSVTCAAPSGRTACVLAEFGRSPRHNRTATEGPWCNAAATFTAQPW